MKELHEPTPGELLQTEFLDEYGITAYQLAKATKMQPTRVSEILHGKRSISLDTAQRLSRYFGTTVAFWINMQMQYEIRSQNSRTKKQIAQIRPIKLKLDTVQVDQDIPVERTENDIPFLNPALRPA